MNYARIEPLFSVSLADLPSGGVEELAARVVERVAAVSTRCVDDEQLCDELLPFDLLDRVWRESAEDDSPGFMGPSYCVFSVYKLAQNYYLVVEDRIETGEYEVLGSASALEGALTSIRRAVKERLGDNGTITFSDGTKIDQSCSPED